MQCAPRALGRHWQIVSMQLLAADEAQARTMEHYFKAHAEDVYQALVRMLTESEENKA